MQSSNTEMELFLMAFYGSLSTCSVNLLPTGQQAMSYLMIQWNINQKLQHCTAE